jgi:hypothetical protein
MNTTVNNGVLKGRGTFWPAERLQASQGLCSSMLPLLQYAATAPVCCHCSSMLPLLQYAATATVCCHCSSMLPLLQYAATATVCCHCSSMLPLLQYAATATVCCHCYSMLPLLRRRTSTYTLPLLHSLLLWYSINVKYTHNLPCINSNNLFT